MKSRLDNFALNISSSGIKFILATVIGFVLTPYIVKNVGIEAFGLFKTLQDYVAYLMLLEFGLYGALLATFNKIISDKNKNFEHQVFWLGLKSYLKITLIGLAIGLLFMPIVTKVIKYEYLPDHSFYYSFLALLLSFLTLPFLSFKAYLDASQKGYQINFGLLIQVLVNAVFIIVSIQFNLGVPGLCTALLLSGLLSSLYFFKASGIKIKDVITSKTDALKNSEIISKLNKMRKAMFFTDLAGRVCLLSDNIIIGYILGIKFVTPFFLTQRLSQIVQTQLQNISNSSWAGLGEIYHNKSPEALGESLIDLTKWISILAVSTLVPIATYNQSFISIWTGTETYAGNLITIIACFNAFFLGVLSLWGWCFTATSKIDLLVPINWTQTIINITLNIILTIKYGLIGPILATLICYVFINITWIGHLVGREFKANIVKVHLNWMLPLTYGCICFFLWKELRQEISNLGWIRLLFEMAFEGSTILALSFFLVMTKRERKASFDRVKKLMRR